MTQPASAVNGPGSLAPEPGPRQFDFWLGDWDVTWGDGQRGRNHVAASLDGHVVQETVDGRPSLPLQGVSLSVYSPGRGLWQQTWVDNSGNYWAFTGRFEAGRMVLATQVERDGPPVHLRMVWHNLAPDSLDWHWKRSDDSGQTWTVLWALHYARRPA